MRAMMVERNEYVGLRVVRGRATWRGRIGDDAVAIGTTFGPGKQADKVNRLAVRETQPSDVGRVDHDDVSVAGDASVAVVVAIDGRVVLIV